MVCTSTCVDSYGSECFNRKGHFVNIARSFRASLIAFGVMGFGGRDA